MRAFEVLFGLAVVLGACSPRSDAGSSESAIPPLPTDPVLMTELRNVFTSHDMDGDGRVTVGDIERFGQSMFAGMDVRTDGEIVPKEWRGYGFLESTARDNGRSAEYEEAKRATFQRYDTDHSGTLSPAELRQGVHGDFGIADSTDADAAGMDFDHFSAARIVREMAHAAAKSAG